MFFISAQVPVFYLPSCNSYHYIWGHCLGGVLLAWRFTWGLLFHCRGSSGIKIFSNCSVHDYRYFVSKFEAKCLQNFSNLQPLYQNQSVCGNGILEPNEDCDCGSQEVSNKNWNLSTNSCVSNKWLSWYIWNNICNYVFNIEPRYEMSVSWGYMNNFSIPLQLRKQMSHENLVCIYCYQVWQQTGFAYVG